MCQPAKTRIIRKILQYGRRLWEERLREWESQERTGRTTAYRNKSRKRGKIESNQGASTDLRETRMHEDAPAVGICFYYKVCKWRTRNAAGVLVRGPCLSFSIPSYGGTVINWIVRRE